MEEQEQKEELGIDLIKKLLKSVFDGVAEFVEAKQDDGKVSRMELLGLGDNAIAIGANVMKMNEIIAQAKDADSSERKELIEYVVSLGVIGSDAEILLVNTFEYIEGQILLYTTNGVVIVDTIKRMIAEKKESTEE